MTKGNHYIIKGYILMLETAPPNGRYVHQVRNKITGLRFYLALGVDSIPDEYEAEVKALIRHLYPQSQTNPTTDQNLDVLYTG